jgi:hypothetical protein
MKWMLGLEMMGGMWDDIKTAVWNLNLTPSAQKAIIELHKCCT